MAAFKMKGFGGFGNSPMKQHISRHKKTAIKTESGHNLAFKNLPDGTKEYYKIDANEKKTIISKSEWDALKKGLKRDK